MFNGFHPHYRTKLNPIRGNQLNQNTVKSVQNKNAQGISFMFHESNFENLCN